MSKLSPFDFVNSINSRDKPDLINDDIEAEKAYNAFIINRQFSYFPDTVFLANELNGKSHIPPKMQYEFLRHVVSPRKRWAKWHKKSSDELLKLAAQYYGVSQRALRYSLDLLSDDEINKMKIIVSHGGCKKNK